MTDYKRPKGRYIPRRSPRRRKFTFPFITSSLPAYLAHPTMPCRPLFILKQTPFASCSTTLLVHLTFFGHPWNLRSIRIFSVAKQNACPGRARCVGFPSILLRSVPGLLIGRANCCRLTRPVFQFSTVCTSTSPTRWHLSYSAFCMLSRLVSTPGNASKSGC